MISIAMATYNGAKYIREQIDSILNQTIQEFELVICDDCSGDETPSILNEYVGKDNRIKFFRNECNMGFKNNFENVIRKCNGDFVALSDQDDIWSPDHLKILVGAMNDNTQLACGSPVFVDEFNNKLPKKYDYLKKNIVPSNDNDMARHIFLCRSTFQGASMLLKKSFFNIALPIPEGADFHDSWFAALACFSGGLAFVDKPVMRYRRYGSAVTSSQRKLSPARLLAGSVFGRHSVKDRLVFIKNIRERVSDLTIDQLELLNTFECMLSRRKTLIGRIENIPYLLKHFQAIYCDDIKHLFSI